MDNINVSDPERCSFKGGVCPISGPAPLQPRLHFILQNSFQISFNQCPNIENHNTETMVGKQRIQVWFRFFFLVSCISATVEIISKNTTKPLDMCGAGLNESWICRTSVLMCKVGNEKQFWFSLWAAVAFVALCALMSTIGPAFKVVAERRGKKK